MTSYRILVVEDIEWIDILNRKIDKLLLIINAEDSVVKYIPTFREAYTILKSEEQWHLLVTDLGLGNPQESMKMKGLELVDLATEKNIPVIVVSGTINTTPLVVSELYDEYGVDTFAFFSKINFREKTEKFFNKVKKFLLKNNNLMITIQKDLIQIGIITIRDDEYSSILNRLINPTFFDGERNRYRITKLENGINVAVTRCQDQGNLCAQDIARNMLEELSPNWIFVVGIGGGLPDSDFSLGDVIVSSSIYDLTTEAADRDGRTYDIREGWLHNSAIKVIQDLPGSIERELSHWNASVTERPSMDLSTVRNSIYGSDEWKSNVEKSLKHNFSKHRKPRIIIGKIAASDTLIKDYTIPNQWAKVARKIKAVEMESAGVYRAARHLPILAIRGISDIVGLRRDETWTKYACETAAAFALTLANSSLLPM